MAEKLSDKLKGLFKRADTYLGKAIERKPKSLTGIGPSQTQYKMFKAGKKTKNLMKGLSLTKKFDKPASASKALITASAAKKARNIGKLKTIGRIASRAALPVAAGFEAANLAYKVATLSPEKKAKIKKLKTNLKKTSTKDYHADLMKMRTGGDTMIKNKEKADLDKDGKLSKYEKKRGKAIESNMMKANMGMEAKSTQGYGAARTSGMGLQDENLIPGKSLDYYKDIM